MPGPSILIVNQHGENRGDEAALRAMLHGFRERLVDPHFTVLLEVRDRQLPLDLGDDVEVLHELDLLPGAAGLALLALGLRVRRLLPGTAGRLADAYERADLVVSAPGGPYFGDGYWRNEPVHWFLAWLGVRRRKPVFYYAPSAGPFRLRLLNPVRRALFRRLARPLAVREERSAVHLRELLGPAAPVEVTADSALQRRLPPAPREDGDDRFVVAVSALRWRWPGHPDPDGAQAAYDAAVVAGLAHLADRRPDAHLRFFPQLYGARHSDVPYLRSLAERLPAGTSWEVVDPGLDSDGQQRLLGASDLVLAGRYHPQVFAVAAGVPGVCVAYEHKARGLMEAVGLGDLVIDAATVTPAGLAKAFDRVLDERDAIAARLREAAAHLERRSARTTTMAVAAMRAGGRR
ncbi:MAG TPA: polysaccharide pyruvyl transferase family protein [Acidimicrobiales bacterium]